MMPDDNTITFPGKNKRLANKNEGAIFVDRLIQDDSNYYSLTCTDGGITIPEDLLPATMVAIFKKIPPEKINSIRKQIEELMHAKKDT